MPSLHMLQAEEMVALAAILDEDCAFRLFANTHDGGTCSTTPQHKELDPTVLLELGPPAALTTLSCEISLHVVRHSCCANCAATLAALHLTAMTLPAGGACCRPTVDAAGATSCCAADTSRWRWGSRGASTGYLQASGSGSTPAPAGCAPCPSS